MINTLFKDFKLPKKKTTVIDNCIFQLHYKFTFLILVVFSLLVTARQYIGEPIHCMTGMAKDTIPQKLIDTFCWIHTTFSVNEAWHQKVGDEVIYPGISNSRAKEKEDNSNTVTYHAYYQWVCFVLFIQALLFYVPHFYWKTVIGSRIGNLVGNLNNPILPHDEKKKTRKLLCDYLLLSLSHHNNHHFLSYIFAEFLNFTNVIGQMFLMNKFLDGHFMTYGLDVISFSERDGTVRYDPMIRVFPRLTKCTFHQFGSSGDVKRHDNLCLLPVNIINEKIYIFLWFWFIMLAILSGLILLYRLVTIFWSPLRFFSLHSRCRKIDSDHLKAVMTCCRYSDWMLLIFLAKNIDSTHFKDLINDLGLRVTLTDDKDSSTA